MPFYCGKRSAGSWVVLGPKQSRLPHYVGGAHNHGATYSSHRALSTYFTGTKCVASTTSSFASQRRIARTDSQEPKEWYRNGTVRGLCEKRSLHRRKRGRDIPWLK